MANGETSINSILAVDCGNVTTTALLIEAVEGEYRLLAAGRAPSSHAAPQRDITVGVLAAIRHIEQETGKTLLASGNWPITPRNSSGQGIDAFLVVASAAEPLAVALIGLTQDISLTSARRAAATTYTFITNELTLDRGEENRQQSAEGRIQALREGQPETILLVGGANGGARRPVTEMAHIIAMAMQVLWQVKKPTVIYAGNADAQAEVTNILQPVANLHVVDNLRPTLERENLAATQVKLQEFYIQRKMARLPGVDKLQKWLQFPLTPTNHSFEKVITYLGQQHQLNVMGVDLGSHNTHIATLAAEQPQATLRTDAGVGHSLGALIKKTPPERFHRWLPLEVDPGTLHNHLLNRSLHPASLPTDEASLLLEYAIAREALRAAMEPLRSGWREQAAVGRHGPQWHWLIGAGQTLVGTPHLGYAALMLLDGVEPWGVTKLTLDVSNVTKALGAVAAIAPLAAVEVAAHPNTFLNLGTVIAPLGHGPANKKALNLKVYEGDEPIVTVDVAYGSLEVIDLPPGKKVSVEMRPTRFFDIGLGQPGRGAVAEVEGGLLGLIIDARGRPLRLPQNEAKRQQQLMAWQAALGINHSEQ